MSQNLKLTQKTTFSRKLGAETITHEYPAGTEYVYTRTEDALTITRTATITDGPVVWTAVHRTQKAPAPVTAPKPSNGAVLARTGVAAHEAISVIAGKTERALDAQENHVRRLEAVTKMLSGKVYQVNYYIPTELDIPNPAGLFRKHGFSLDGSNKILTEKGLNSEDIQNLFASWDKLSPVSVPSSIPGFSRTRRMRYWVTEITPEQLAAMKEQAQEQLAEALQEAHASLLGRIETAAKTLEDARDALPPEATERNRSKIEGAYFGAVRDTIRTATECFESCLKGAELFDDTGSLDAMFKAVKDAIYATALAENAKMRAANRKEVELPTSISG